jgi:HSP20 family protein
MLTSPMDLSETDQELKICAELPGVTDDDINIQLQDDVLVIRGEKKFEGKDEKKNYHLIERSYGTFQRALRLPGPVDMDQVQARLEHGVLTVIVPKSQQKGRSRRIKIQGQKPEPGQLEG